MKNCPYCAELVQDDAKKCKHCGEWFENKAQFLFKKAKSFIKEQGLKHQAKIEENRQKPNKIRLGQLLNYIDYLEANLIIRVGYEESVFHKSPDRQFTIVHGNAAGRGSIDIQIIDRDTIKIDNFGPSTYNGYLGILKSPDIGNTMYFVLSDLYKRINGEELRF